MNNCLHRGDIFFIESSSRDIATGCEQRGVRPGVIVSNNLNNRHSTIVEIVYLTTKNKTDLPTHVSVESTKKPSIALCEQIHSISTGRLGRHLGRLTKEEMNKVNKALMVSLQLNMLEDCG